MQHCINTSGKVNQNFYSMNLHLSEIFFQNSHVHLDWQINSVCSTDHIYESYKSLEHLFDLLPRIHIWCLTINVLKADRHRKTEQAVHYSKLKNTVRKNGYIIDVKYFNRTRKKQTNAISISILRWESRKDIGN